LVFGGGGGGKAGCFREGGIARFSDGGISDTHLANLAAAVPDASPSSSSHMVGGLLTNLFICSVFSSNLFWMSAFNHSLKDSFSFWYSLFRFSFWTCSEKG
jgi:hypothetical protein